MGRLSSVSLAAIINRVGDEHSFSASNSSNNSIADKFVHFNRVFRQLVRTLDGELRSLYADHILEYSGKA
ncbi:MAG: hypothetical protein CMM53_01350 [Rhodospirillaceae bacterium]|nr:hypothetical protein [Rhodospirillaceae bacterium]